MPVGAALCAGSDIMGFRIWYTVLPHKRIYKKRIKAGAAAPAFTAQRFFLRKGGRIVRRNIDAVHGLKM